MNSGNINVAAVLGLVYLVLGFAPATSRSEEAKTVEWYLEQARPYLHHSCQSVWDAVGQDEDKFVEMVGTVSAVSFYNRNFDIERLRSLPQDKQDQLQQEFYEEIGDLCREDGQALFAGVVDRSLTSAIDKIVAAE